MNGGCSEEIDISEDTAESPCVLVLEVAAVGISIDFNCQHVFTIVNIFCDIEFGGCSATLAISNFFAIYPEIKGASDAVKVKEDLSCFPTGGDGEFGSI